MLDKTLYFYLKNPYVYKTSNKFEYSYTLYELLQNPIVNTNTIQKSELLKNPKLYATV